MSAQIITLYFNVHETKVEAEAIKANLRDMIETQLICLGMDLTMKLHDARRDVAEYQASLPVKFDPNF